MTTEIPVERKRSLPQQVVDSANKEVERDYTPVYAKEDLLPTGSTLLNLACSDMWEGALKKGRMVNFIGDSSSGKSLLSLQCLIEACFSPHFSDYELYYDDVEGGCDFDIEKMFGEVALEKSNRINFISSEDIEEWQDTMLELQKRNAKFIYILDSYDVIDSKQAKQKADEEAAARAKGKEVSGSYGMDKVKRVRSLFRPAISAMKKTDSIVIIISQTKAVIDPRSFKKKTRSAEDALEFHSYHCIWLANAGKEVLRDYVIGNKTKVKVKKNRLTGKKEREVDFSIFTDYGIDDIGSCIDYLVEKEHWKLSKQTIIAHDFDISCTKQKLIKEIESKRLLRKLRVIVGEVWNEIEDSLKLNRKPRYE